MTASAPDSPSAATVAMPAEERVLRVPAELIDQSCRWPVLILVSHAILWLLFGLSVSFLVAVKFHAPGFLADISWLTVGRLRPVATNALIYGFIFQAAFPVMLWIICRLGGVELLNRSLILFSVALWNLGVTVGLVAILAGFSSGFTWLEMPMAVVGMLFVAYALMAIWTLITFHYRRERELYVSQWYFVAALFVFPWIYSGANYLLLGPATRGVMQVVVDAWYVNNLLALVFTPVALGIVFYFLPKLLGRPLYSRSLAIMGFWTQLLFGAWTGLVSMIGAPLPFWMISASIGANLLMAIPVLATLLNWHFTLSGRYGRVKNDLVLRFIFCAMVAYAIGSIERIVVGCPRIARYTELTFVGTAWTHLMLLGFVSMASLGAIYYIVPRVAHIEWPCPRRPRLHLVLTAAGVALYFLALTAGGLLQGAKMQDPAHDILSVMKMTVPFVGMGTLATLLILAGQVSFAINFGLLLKEFCAVYCPPNCGMAKLRSWTEPRRSAATPTVEVRP